MKKTLYIAIGFLLCFNMHGQIKMDSIILYYPFAGNANDYSGDSLHGQVFGASLAADRFGLDSNAYEFDGTNDYIVIPDTSLIKQPNFPFSVSVWVKIHQFNNKFISIFKSCESANHYCGYSVNYSPTGYITAGYANGGSVSTFNRRTRVTNETLTLNEWHHILVSYASSSKIDIYIDGAPTTGYYSGSANSLGYVAAPGVMGRNSAPSGTYYHQGLIDDLRVYSDTTSLKDAQFLFYESPCSGNINLYDTIPVFDTLAVFDTIVEYDTISIVNNIIIVDTLLINVPIGLPEHEFTQVKIYPNPTQQIIRIEFSEQSINNNLGFIAITTEIGQQVYHHPIKREYIEIDVAKLGPSGIYFVQVLNKKGEIVSRRTIVLNK